MNSGRPDRHFVKPFFAGCVATMALVIAGYAWVHEWEVTHVEAGPPVQKDQKQATSKPTGDKPAKDDQKARARDDRDRPPPEDRPARRWRPRWQDRRDFGDRPPRRGGPDDRGPRRGEFRPDDRRGGPDDFELPPEAIAELEEMTRTEMPFLYDRLQTWKERNPGRFRDAMLRIYPAFRDYVILKNRNPELAKTVIEELRLEVEIRKLSEQYQAAAKDSPERKKIEDELAQKVRRQLDIRIARREDRLSELAKKLKREQDKLAAEKSRLDAACAQRLKQIMKGKFTDFFEGPPGRPGPRGPGDGEGPDGPGFRPPPHGHGMEGDDGPPDEDRPPRGRFGPPPRDRDGPRGRDRDDRDHDDRDRHDRGNDDRDEDRPPPDDRP